MFSCMKISCTFCRHLKPQILNLMNTKKKSQMGKKWIIFLVGCDHNQMSQRWWTQGLQSFLWSFSLSHKNDFWDEIFCNMLLTIHILFSIHHIFCINFSWIFKNFQKVHRFYQILCFILKHYLNSNFMKIC
jgi:hypothetical protein